MNDAPDELYMVKNHFWVGNFQQVIQEGADLRTSSKAVVAERDAYVYRAYVAMKNAGMVIDETELSDDLLPPILAAKLLAEYTLANEGDSGANERAKAVQGLRDLVASLQGGAGVVGNSLVQSVAATVYQREGDIPSALEAIRGQVDLEQRALAVQCYLALNRMDLAQRTLQVMQREDDDSALTQLCTAWLHMAQGGAKYQEAVYIFQELMDNYGATVSLLNGIGVANMHLGNLEEAQGSLTEALGMDATCPETLANLVVCAQRSDKGDEAVDRRREALRKVAPKHESLKRYDELKSGFAEAAAAFN
jgi:tetratricopeptide (TPR) repeat protein